MSAAFERLSASAEREATAAKRVVRYYLWGTTGRLFSLKLGTCSTNAIFPIGFSDSDYAALHRVQNLRKATRMFAR